MSYTITLDAAGSSTFSLMIGTPSPTGSAITATATDPVGSTSGFSAGLTVT